MKTAKKPGNHSHSGESASSPPAHVPPEKLRRLLELSRVLDVARLLEFSDHELRHTSQQRVRIDCDVAEPLWPQRFGRGYLDAIRRGSIGAGVFSKTYMGFPSEARSAILDPSWFDRYPVSADIPVVEFIQSWDMAFKTGQTNDYSACVTAAIGTDGSILIVDAFHVRAPFHDVEARVRDMWAAWGASTVLVEDAAAGQSILQSMTLRAFMVPMVPVRADRDKVSRMNAVTPFVRARRILLPERAPWLREFLDELCDFPFGSHDDMADAFSQLVNYLVERASGALRAAALRANNGFEEIEDGLHGDALEAALLESW